MLIEGKNQNKQGIHQRYTKYKIYATYNTLKEQLQNLVNLQENIMALKKMKVLDQHSEYCSTNIINNHKLGVAHEFPYSGPIIIEQPLSTVWLSTDILKKWPLY